MKIRASNEWLERTRNHAEWIGVTRADLIRRCLKKWVYRGCVDVSEYRETTTRENSQPVGVNPEGLVGEYFTGRDVVAVVNWALAQIPPERKQAAGIGHNPTELKEGKDYVIKEAE